jgi:hypothetical protein
MMPLTCVHSLNILPKSFVHKRTLINTPPLVRAFGHRFSILVACPVLIFNLKLPHINETLSFSWNLLLIP